MSEEVFNGESKKDCRFYNDETDNHGCTALNRLYCKLENKPCRFYKKVDESEGQAWAKIENEYINGRATLIELALKYNVSSSAMASRSRKGNWVKKRKEKRK